MNTLLVGGSVLNGIGSLQYTGTSVLMSQPETGALIAEYTLQGGVNRLIGSLRRTGHEDDPEVHLALNSGIPLVDPAGGFLFVFQAGEPAFQKYDRNGTLVFERRLAGVEIDPLIAGQPTAWPKRKTSEGEMPLVTPTIRTAAVDGAGNLWISFVVPYTYVYDRDGDKIRAVQFRGAGIVAPNSLFFGGKGQLLVTPGLYEFETEGAGRAGKAGPAGGLTLPSLSTLPLPHGQIRAFNKRCGDVLRIAVAPNNLLRRARELCRAVARRSGLFSRHATRVVFLNHRVVDVDAERVVHGVHIPVEAVRRQLCVTGDP